MSKSTLFGIIVGVVTGGLILVAGVLFVRYYLFAGDRNDPRFEKRSCLFCSGLVSPTSALLEIRQYWTRSPNDVRLPLLISLRADRPAGDPA